MPVGSIVSWVMKIEAGGEFVDLPAGWMRCDGSTIPHGSIWEGKKLPNLNGERRFLRGGPDESVLSLEEDQILDHDHNHDDPGHSHSYTDHYAKRDSGSGCENHIPDGGDHDKICYDSTLSPSTGSVSTGFSVTGVKDANHGSENRVKNMNVIWIMRVW